MQNAIIYLCDPYCSIATYAR